MPTEPIKEPFPHTSCNFQPQSLDSHVADSFPAVFGKLQRSWHPPARHDRGITWSLTSAHRQRESPARRESLYAPGKETMCIGCFMFTLAHALRIALALGITQCVMLMFTHGDPRIRSGKTVSHTRISQVHVCWAHWKYGKLCESENVKSSQPCHCLVVPGSLTRSYRSNYYQIRGTTTSVMTCVMNQATTLMW